MPATPDNVALVRLNISDEGEDQLLSDQKLSLLLDHYQGSTNRASARALRIIAASEVLVGKVIKTQDLSTDGRAVSDALRRLAEDYDAEAEREEADDIGSFHIVPFGGAGRAEGEEYRYRGWE